jgi:NitT/TauT family transport system substrate-binding protein
MLAAHGLDVDLTMAQNGSVISAALIAGSAQIGGPTPTVVLQADEAGLDLVIVAACQVYPNTTPSGVLASPASGVHGPKDLAGKKVGVPGLGGIIDVLTKKWVQSNGLDYHQVSWIELTFPQMADALKSGAVDAVASVDPFYSRILNAKLAEPIGDYSAVVPAGTIPLVYASTRAWASANPQAVASFRSALGEAVAYIYDPAHVQSVRDSIARYTKLPPEIAATVPIPTNFVVQAKPEGMKFWIEVGHEQGLIKGNPDAASMIAPGASAPPTQ